MWWRLLSLIWSCRGQGQGHQRPAMVFCQPDLPEQRSLLHHRLEQAQLGDWPRPGPPCIIWRAGGGGGTKREAFPHPLAPQHQRGWPPTTIDPLDEPCTGPAQLVAGEQPCHEPASHPWRKALLPSAPARLPSSIANTATWPTMESVWSRSSCTNCTSVTATAAQEGLLRVCVWYGGRGGG